MNSEQIRNVIDNKKSSLLFSSQEEQDIWFETIKKKTAYQPLLEEIRVEANRLLSEPSQELTFSTFTIFRDTGARLEYEKAYFAKRRRLNTFVIMTLLQPKHSEYLEELQNMIWSICNEYTWCLPAHLKNSPEMATNSKGSISQTLQQPTYSIDLFAAETAFTLSEILKLTKNLLDPLLQKRMVEEVYRRVFLPFCHQPPFEWETSTHNWSSVCAGSIGSAALHIIEDEEMLSAILERVLSSMNYYLKGFNDDGACMEGYGYWQYGFGYYVYFADLLKKKTNGKIDLFDSEKVHQIALFQQKCFLYKNQVVNFSDSVQKATIFLGLSHYLKKIFPDVEAPEIDLRASYTEDHCSRWAPALRNLLWFDEHEEGVPWQNNTYYLRDSQWFISRNDHSVFACKGGHNDEPHNHNDIGHFILQAYGETFLRDLGSGLYSAAYFSEERYTLLCNGSQGHSVPIINNQFQAAGADHFATVKNVSIADDIDTFEIDMANTYDVKSLQKLQRKFSWNKDAKPELILRDTYQFSEQPDSIVERFITPFLQMTEDHEGVILNGNQKIKIKYNREQLDLIIREAEFVNHFGEKEDLLMLDFAVKNLSDSVQVEIVFQVL
ncbi:heparinase II/III family protein [uncultured Metabacillus sp.]|uniref:heparinase II/III domain-containing protein n=1 Tax=uncultured Metabacillus sp. TaxID=2860135 RepID=UPI002602F1F2|nr:heparinase II/III family protein [uncultured Metabacillus sp.]